MFSSRSQRSQRVQRRAAKYTEPNLLGRTEVAYHRDSVANFSLNTKLWDDQKKLFGEDGKIVTATKT